MAPVAMCYVVVIADHPASASDDLRVRFEFRPDVASAAGETRTVLGVDAACSTFRAWVDSIVT
jgi:hypothetical protein